VSVGSFRNADNARRQAELFRQAGYPVFIATQEDLNLVLLGPYRLETEAERVRAAVAAGGFDVAPIIYTFRPEGEAAAPAAAQPAAATAPQPAAAAPASTAQPAAAAPAAPQPAATASEAGRYLQAGAYSTQDYAQLQRSAIEELGFRVSVVQEGTLLRVLVGPYGDADLEAARSSLARQGIDSIPR
jgi:cell division protein FtsN